MTDTTKIDFRYRRIGQLSDLTELAEMLFPGNRNQQYAAATILFELKWTDSIVPNLTFIENKYQISRRIIQRTRAKLTRLGLIEHVSRFNARYGGQEGWILSNRFESGLRQLAEKVGTFKSTEKGSKEKEMMLLSLADARRNTAKQNKEVDTHG